MKQARRQARVVVRDVSPGSGQGSGLKHLRRAKYATVGLVSPGSGQGSGLKLARRPTTVTASRSPLAPVRGAD